MRRDANIFIEDINTRAKKLFEISNKLHLWTQIQLVAPSEDNSAYAAALDDVKTRRITKKATFLSLRVPSQIMAWSDVLSRLKTTECLKVRAW